MPQDSSAARERESESAAPALRGPGLLVFVGIVAIGFAAGAGYFRFAAPRAKAETEARLAEAPTTAEGRVEVWIEYAEPILLERLRQARLSSQQPWIVTHTVEPEDGEAPEVWGISSDSLEPGFVRSEGLEVVVTLGAPRLLARTTPVGDHARSVPRFATDARPEDPGEMLRRIADFALQYQSEKLAEDIPGASLRIEIEDSPSAS